MMANNGCQTIKMMVFRNREVMDMLKTCVPAELTADSLKQKRKALGLTQKAFAELIGVSKPTVERWESSDAPVKGPVVLLLGLLTPDALEAITVPEKTLPLRLWYMYRDEVCTVIDVDESSQTVKIKNFVRNRQYRAFGLNESPTYRDYCDFLESRCFPRERDKMKLILREMDLPFYDPLMIIKRTEGRMAEDDFWLRVEL